MEHLLTLTNDKGEVGNSFYYNYHGMTSRTMPIRMEEHKKAKSNFGESYRDVIAIDKNATHMHIIVSDGLTKEEAFNLEEKVIKANSLFRDGKGNNMIPGGYTGLRIAKKLGYKDRESAEIDLEEASEDSNKLEEIEKVADICKLLRKEDDYYIGRDIYNRVKDVIDGKTYRFAT